MNIAPLVRTTADASAATWQSVPPDDKFHSRHKLVKSSGHAELFVVCDRFVFWRIVLGLWDIRLYGGEFYLSLVRCCSDGWESVGATNKEVTRRTCRGCVPEQAVGQASGWVVKQRGGQIRRISMLFHPN